MKYGFFDDAPREYVITQPLTPYPWINYLGCESFFGICSNTGGGYCFYKDSRLRRLTRYRYNNVPVDDGGRYYYINDGGDVWTPGFRPVMAPVEGYECRHGLGYTRISSERNGVKAETLFFVPIGHNCELHQVTLTNKSGKNKALKLFSLAEFCLWNAYDDMTNFQRNFNTGEVEIENGVIYHKTEYRERRNHFAYYSVNKAPAAFDTQLEDFLGAYGSFAHPAAVFQGQCTNSVASGWQPCGCHQLEVSLEPGESETFIFQLGYIENDEDKKFSAPNVINKEKAKAEIALFSDEKSAQRAFDELRAHWDELLSKYTLSIEDKKLSRMVNIWNQYQCITTYNLSRSASLFESGIGRGLGFRDSSQDLLGFVHQLPANARERILDIAATQFEDGGAFHQYQPLTKKGNNDIGTGFNDDPLWLIAGVTAYIKETGDWAILDEPVPFTGSEKPAVLLDHLKASYEHVVKNKGPHGLPLIGRADWNDCLNLNCFSTTPDDSFQTTGSSEGSIAESVLIAGLFVAFCPDFAEVLRRRDENELAAEVVKESEAMKAAVLKNGYDGEWFLRAYDAFGHKVGSNECDEGKIYIESQGFCVMAGIGKEDGRAKKALDSVEKYLETEHGVMILQPAYTRYHTELGEISSYPPGYKENAGIFCHNNPWIICAHAVLGNGDKAFELYKRIAPAYREDISELHKLEPYVYPQMIAGKDAKHFGQAKNSWLTGTAAWNFVAISQYILGVKPAFDGLLIDPCIPAGWKQYTVRRVFRGTTFNITVSNRSGKGHGVASVTLDGSPSSSLLTTLDGGSHAVRVEI